MITNIQKTVPIKCIPHRHIPSNSLVVSNLWKAISFSYFWLNSRTPGNQIEVDATNRWNNQQQRRKPESKWWLLSRLWRMIRAAAAAGRKSKKNVCALFLHTNWNRNLMVMMRVRHSLRNGILSISDARRGKAVFGTRNKRFSSADEAKDVIRGLDSHVVSTFDLFGSSQQRVYL